MSNNIDEKAIWEWMGYQRRGGQWVKKLSPRLYESIGNPDLKSLDVQAKYLWPKLREHLNKITEDRRNEFLTWQLVGDEDAKGEVVYSVEIDIEYSRDGCNRAIYKTHKDPATAVLLAVTELIGGK